MVVCSGRSFQTRGTVKARLPTVESLPGGCYYSRRLHVAGADRALFVVLTEPQMADTHPPKHSAELYMSLLRRCAVGLECCASERQTDASANSCNRWRPKPWPTDDIKRLDRTINCGYCPAIQKFVCDLWPPSAATTEQVNRDQWKHVSRLSHRRNDET